jgi:hypothetical protein
MPKTRTRTVRLDSDLDEAIQRRAREDKVTTNFLINRTMRKLIEWDIPGRKIGYMEVPEIMVKKLIDEFDADKCTELGRFTAREFARPLTEYLFGEVTATAFISTFKRVAFYTDRFVFDDVQEGNVHILVFRHDQGRKWTNFYQGLVKEILHDLLSKQVKFECTDAVCIARFEA